MKTSYTLTLRSNDASAEGFPRADELAALRAWYAGLSTREAVQRYLPLALGARKSARGVLGQIRRRLLAIAGAAQRDDLIQLLAHPAQKREQYAKAVGLAIEALRTARPPEPAIADDVALWFSPRAARVLHAQGITTLADLTVRIPRRRQWWKGVPGLGAASARAIEAFFAARPALTDKARTLIAASQRDDIVPWKPSGCRMKLTAPKASSGHLVQPARSTRRTTTQQSRLGSPCTNHRPHNEPTGKKPNGSSCGRSSSVVVRFRPHD